MRIMSARVTSYKSVSDSGEFTLEPDVTCLVGKNESGKTAVLEAMYRLNPLPTGHPETFEEGDRSSSNRRDADLFSGDVDVFVGVWEPVAELEGWVA